MGQGIYIERSEVESDQLSAGGSFLRPRPTSPESTHHQSLARQPSNPQDGPAPDIRPGAENIRREQSGWMILVTM